MEKIKNRYVLKGFTIAELLVVLALTSVAMTLSYGTLNYIQKLFIDYKKQNRFLNEFTDLKKRLDYDSLSAKQVTEKSENEFEIRRDSVLIYLQLQKEVILLTQNAHCDTFHFAARNIKKQYEAMHNPAWVNKLVSSLEFEVMFVKQNYTLCFSREHSAALKLNLDREEAMWQH